MFNNGYDIEVYADQYEEIQRELSEMASEVIKNGGHVYGAMWGDKYDIVHHTYIDDEADIKKLQGSKYVQSNILDSYKNVLNDINNGKKILFIWCEILFFTR